MKIITKDSFKILKQLKIQTKCYLSTIVFELIKRTFTVTLLNSKTVREDVKWQDMDFVVVLITTAHTIMTELVTASVVLKWYFAVTPNYSILKSVVLQM